MCYLQHHKIRAQSLNPFKNRFKQDYTEEIIPLYEVATQKNLPFSSWS